MLSLSFFARKNSRRRTIGQIMRPYIIIFARPVFANASLRTLEFIFCSPCTGESCHRVPIFKRLSCYYPYGIYLAYSRVCFLTSINDTLRSPLADFNQSMRAFFCIWRENGMPVSAR